MKRKLDIALLFAGFGLIAFSPLGLWLEQSLVTHVLLEIPLLVSLGWAMGVRLRKSLRGTLSWTNAGGISGLLLASFTLAFWMIPRWLDASLNDSWIAGLKYVSLVLLVGVPLALSWPMAHSIVRAVVKIEFLTMLFRLGWIYLISPQRLCNNYLLDDQVRLGEGFLLIGIALAITWLLPVFFGRHSERNSSLLLEPMSANTRCS